MMTLLNYALDVMDEEQPAAWAYLHGNDSHPDLKGMALFYPMEEATLVVVTAQGLPGLGFHGLHIHEGGKCSGNAEDEFSDAGLHYNPGNMEHPFHAGDLPPLLSDGGTAFLAFVTGRFTPEDVEGKTMIIHDMADDFHSQPSGGSGNKIACGVIQRTLVK